MKKYKVNVNGTAYEITVELLDETACTSSPVAPATPSSPTPTQVSHSSIKVSSPMPGTILSIPVSVGQVVKKGDTLMILEAMKMENEILASQDGKVVALHITQGATVESGTLLCEIV